MNLFMRQLRPALVAMIALTTLLGVAYPLIVTGVSQLLWHDKANGSLIEEDGVVVGSSLIGQQFTSPQYFHPRPSAAGDGYDASASSGSNLGPTNPDYLKTVTQRVAAYREENGLGNDALVPNDAVTASGSGLDPQISVRNARLQAPRVAEQRGLPLEQVMAQIDEHTSRRPLAVLGDPGVNVLELNLALDDLGR
jgi:K+-transporting ATPase ATPase C chain